MRPLRPGPSRLAFLTVALAVAFLTPITHAAEERPAAEKPVLEWDSGIGKSYLIPAVEIPAFFLIHQGWSRLFGEPGTYDVDGDIAWRNLRTAPQFDKDPFNVNQIGHPYQGSLYYGLARSAGLTYWESLGYTLAGSFLWETFGETTKPSLNDYITTTVGGSFVGEAFFRMASLLLEGGGDSPGFWREVGAAVLSPPTAVNRLLFGERFRPTFPSHDPAIFVRLRLGATVTTGVASGGLSHPVKEEEGAVDFYMTYGLPGKPGYQYKRPFDFFLFEFTGVPNAADSRNAIENLTIRGLLAGTSYELGDDYRGLFGLFGGYEYLSPQIFRVASTNLALGTVAQWWMTRTIALQGTALVGTGFGAAGTVGDKEERDYRYGVIPEALLGLRMILGERAMVEAQGRQYWVVGLGDGASAGAEPHGHELINRVNAAFTVRLYGPHALSVQYTVSTRQGPVPHARDRHQSIETLTLSYNFLGHTRFGAVEWRPSEMPR